MIYIFHGGDDFSQRETLEALRRGLDSDGMLASNTTLVDGRTVTADELLSLCQTVPFLSAHRIIIVEGLLARFESRGARERRTRRRRGRGEELSPWQTLAEALRGMPESTTLVLREGEVRTDNPLLRLLEPLAEVREFRPLRQSGDLAGWIVQRASQRGLAIAPRAVALLATLVGNDLWVLSNELDKLAVYVGGRQVDEEDVRALVSSVREASVFAAADAVLEGRTEEAAALVQRFLGEGESAQRLLAVITRHYRQVVLAKDLLAAGRSPAEISARLNVPGFALERVLRAARRYPVDRLRAAYRRLLEADLSIKRGLCDDETALHLLVQDLGTLARAGRATSPRGGRRG